MSRLRVNITFIDFESEGEKVNYNSLELIVRLVERDILTDASCADMNCMYIEWKEFGKIYWENEMKNLDLMIQFKVMKNSKLVGSISFPFKDIFQLPAQFKQWLTVFDTPEDDIFDGILGEDDFEKPRIHVGFDIADEEEQEPTEVSHL